MLLRLAEERWSWARVLAQRLFPPRRPTDALWMTLYRRELDTPAIGHNGRRELKIAF
ncbi:MAG: hypothetical protein JSV80_02060 [Acidobacteriota bacterium]|nr:MAG: hypothetical protein JSV80_02060 [Acidobacteriota bacterium]